MRVRKSATHDQSLVARNWPVGVLLLGALACLVAGTASAVHLPDGNTVDLRGAGLMLGLVGLVLALYGIAVRNVGDAVAVKWLDAHLGKIFIALTVVWTVVSTILNAAYSNLGRVDTPVLIGFMVGLLISWVITGLVMCLYWWLYGRFGFFRVSAVNYMLSMTLYLAGVALISGASSSASSLADADRLTSLPDRPSGGMSSVDRFEEGSPPQEDLDPTSVPLPTLPPLPPMSELAPGVQSTDVRLPVPSTGPGSNSLLYVYRPGESAAVADAQVPCVFIAAAGASPLTGVRLTEADRAEHLPYVRAGYAVVAFEVDGDLPDDDNLTSDGLSAAVERFIAAKAGLVNARNALEFALQRMPFVDRGRLVAAGHSSAGTVALLLAAHEPRITQCVAYAPACDPDRSFPDSARPGYSRAIPDFAGKLRLCSPMTYAGRLNGPLYLFHGLGDTVLPATDTVRFGQEVRLAGGDVTRDTPPGNDHYQDMIETGIPAAIAWLRGRESDEMLVPGEIPPPLKQELADVAGDIPLATGSSGDRKKLPDLGEPDYHDRLVDCIQSDSPFLRRDALKALDRVERADVESTDVLKRIAGAYKQLAFTDGSPDDRRAGIRGMVKWGGKYSVPLLLELLDQQPPFVRPDIYNALGKLADPRAGRPVTQRLGDFHDREEAYRCLQAMGPAAEDAVIEIAPSADAEISMAALRLLADIGTEKCLPILRKAARSRNRVIKEQAKVSTARVRERIAE